MKNILRVLVAVLLVCATVLTVTACGDPCANGHTYGEPNVALAATCTTAGLQTKTCSVCQKVVEETIPATGHSWQDVVAVAPTCTTDGTTAGQVCSVCNLPNPDSTAQVLPAQHTLTKVDAHSATCTEDGNSEYWQCSVCNNLFADENATASTTLADVTITKSGHSMTFHPANPATCQADGTVAYYSCSACTKNFQDEFGATEATNIVDPKHNNHTFGNVVTGEAATCLKAGTKDYKPCTICQRKFSVDGATDITDDLVIAKLSHSYGAWVDQVDATCSVTGTVGYQHCSLCNKDYDSTEVEITDKTIPTNDNHSYGNWIHDTALTDGNHTHTKVCAHNPAHTVTENCAIVHTATTNGHKLTCDVCSYDSGEVAHAFGTNLACVCGAYNVKENVEYRLAVAQEDYSPAKIVYITGVLTSGRFGVTTETKISGMDVYATKVDGGFNLHFTLEGTQKYINAVVSGKYINYGYENAEGATATVWSYDETIGGIVCTMNNSQYVLGIKSSSDKFTTLSLYPVADLQSSTIYLAYLEIACTHANVSHVTAKGATCTADGNKEYWQCTDCNKIYGDSDLTIRWTLADTVTPASGHSFSTTEAITADATCNSTGLSAHFYCTACQKYFGTDKTTEVTLESITTPKLTHLWDDNSWVPADNGTQHTRTCTRGCGEVQTENCALAWAYDATSHWKTCATCGRTTSTNEHNYTLENNTQCECGRHNTPVALTIGESTTMHETLSDAILALNTNADATTATITLSSDLHDDVITIGNQHSVTINLGGFTCTTNGIVLQSGATVAIANGTITTTASGATTLVQNSANLTLTDINLVGTASCGYVLSNLGTGTINGGSVVATQGVAIESRYVKDETTGSVKVTVTNTAITGEVEYVGYTSEYDLTWYGYNIVKMTGVTGNYTLDAHINDGSRTYVVACIKALITIDGVRLDHIVQHHFDETNHWSTCSVCNNIVNVATAHDFVCTDNGNGTHNISCSNTNCMYLAENQPHNLGEYSQTDDSHSQTCADCNAVVSAEHTYDQADGSCICGKEKPIKTEFEMDFTAQEYGNGEEISTIDLDGVTLTFDKGSNSNTPKYYTSGTAIRVYGGNTLTVTAPQGFEIVKIVLTFGSSDGSNAITTDVGTFATPTWTGNAESVTFTVGGSSGNRRIAGIAITLAIPCAHGSLQNVAYVAPTCSTLGVTAHVKCTDCGATFVDDTLATPLADTSIPTTAHNIDGATLENGRIETYNDTHHYALCQVCNNKVEVAHTLSTESTDWLPIEDLDENIALADTHHYTKCLICSARVLEEHKFTSYEQIIVDGAVDTENHTANCLCGHSVVEEHNRQDNACSDCNADLAGTQQEEKSVAFTFTSKEWAADNADVSTWSGTSGKAFESASPSRGVQVNGAAASATSSVSFVNVTKIVIVCSSNGSGTISVTVGDTDFGTISIAKADGNNVEKTLEYAAGASGQVTLSIPQPTSKSVYIKSITIYYAE